MNRKSFIKAGIISTIGLHAATNVLFGRNQPEPEPMNPELVKEFVIAGHFDPDKVKNMLADYPNLIFSQHDWGNGDFEEAIEGAGHKGNKEIANYLIEKGARVNLFVLTMLGKTNLVIPVLEAYPNLVFAKGPHGLSLLHHAEVGGDDSKELLDFLSGKGLTENKFEM